MTAGFVYFIQANEGGPVKIGWSDNPKRRLNQLQAAHHGTLNLLAAVPGGRDTEKSIHGRLDDYRVRGEWFEDCEPVREVMAALQEACNLERQASSSANRQNGNARIAQLGAIYDAMAAVKTCADEDEAIAVGAKLGRQLFRVNLEFAGEEVPA